MGQPFLVSTSTHNGTTENTVHGTDVTRSVQHSRKRLKAHLIFVDPDDDLGPVHVRFECEPNRLPAMTPDELVDFLCRKLRRMLP
jgi:hypothetical protein